MIWIWRFPNGASSRKNHRWIHEINGALGDSPWLWEPSGPSGFEKVYPKIARQSFHHTRGFSSPMRTFFSCLDLGAELGVLAVENWVFEDFLAKKRGFSRHLDVEGSCKRAGKCLAQVRKFLVELSFQEVFPQIEKKWWLVAVWFSVWKCPRKETEMIVFVPVWGCRTGIIFRG